MATDTREDAGQYYPGGDVIPTRPMPSGGGGTIVLDDTVTQSSSNGVKSSGIWTWVKGLLPNWLTPSYAEPATVASVNAKYTRPSSGIPASHLTTAVQAALVNARTPTAHASSHAKGEIDEITPASIGAISSSATVHQTLLSSLEIDNVGGVSVSVGEKLGIFKSDGIVHHDGEGMYNIAFPHKNGTLAVVGDIPDISGKVNKSGDTMTGGLTINNGNLCVGEAAIGQDGSISGSALEGTTLNGITIPLSGTAIATVDDIYDCVNADMTHAKSISANGVSTACTPDESGNVNVSSLFSSEDTSTDPQPSGLLKNSALDIGIVKVTNSIVGVPNATLEAALGTAAS